MKYKLSDLLQFVTICSILCALFPILGVGRAVLLMLATVAIGMRRGDLALVLVAVAIVLVPDGESTPVIGIFVTMIVAAALGAWYTWVRRPRHGGPATKNVGGGPKGATRPDDNPFAVKD